MNQPITRFAPDASPTEIAASAGRNRRQVFTYNPDETVVMTDAPDLRINAQGVLEICEGTGGGVNDEAWLADVWHPIEHVYHLGKHWVALEFTFINRPAQEAFKTLAVVPAEIYHSMM